MLDYSEPTFAQQKPTIQSNKIVGPDKFHYGRLSSTSDLPYGWTASVGGAVYTITHNLGHTHYKFFSTVVMTGSGATIQITSKTSTQLVLASLSSTGGVNPTPDVDFVLIEHAPN